MTIDGYIIMLLRIFPVEQRGYHERFCPDGDGGKMNKNKFVEYHT